MPNFEVKFTPTARDDLKKGLQKYPQKRDKVHKSIKLLEEPGPSYPGLRTHPMRGIKGANNETIYISYVENNTPQAWRIHWSYWGRDTIVILYVGPHT
ncbi:hypothetical protein F4V58_01475 [Corynebacterium phocae]|nr:hypothetical protein F4V58_01475 [Corynebacterium phocae]